MRTMASVLVALLGLIAVSVAPVLAQDNSEQQALVRQYCQGCHNDTAMTAGLSLENLDLNQVGDHAEVWERVVQQLRARAMPPVGMRRPDTSTYEAFRVWLESELDNAAMANPNPGTTVSYHRLNQIEYQNAIRDLLAIDIDASRYLPEDPILHGFDNMGGSLRMTTDLLNRYMRSAMRISRMALGISVDSRMTTYQLRNDLAQDDRFSGLPLGSRGGMEVEHYFPVDGEYSVTVRLVRIGTSQISGLNGVHEIDIRVDGELVDRITIGEEETETGNGGSGGDGGQVDPDVGGAKAAFQFRLPFEAGSHSITATFVGKPVLPQDGTQFILDRPAYEAGRTHGLPYISSVTVLGPQAVTGAADSPSRSKILSCRPETAADEEACARQIVTELAHRAFRGRDSDADIEELMRFYSIGRDGGEFEDGILSALERILVSPQFLFRVEAPPDGFAAGAVYSVPDLELASRLSFFLWSSIPDDELLDVAAEGQLKDPAVLEQQVMRMLADPRAQALTDRFADQWLRLRNMEDVNHDPILFPEANHTLRQSLRRETQLLFDTIRVENRSILDLLTADYTFVNGPTAQLYDIPNIYGPRMRRISLPADSPRAGLLGHGSILMLTSQPDRTSLVLRGKWILENLLDTPPPPPPPNVPVLEEASADDGRILTLREQVIQHRANPMCASCHARMDPLGFALENFDATGRWRETDTNGDPIDATGELMNGTSFEGVSGLREVLLADSDQFVSTAANRLLAYALGRGTEYYDMPAVRKIVRESASADYNFSSLVLGVVESAPFQTRRVPQ